MTFRNLILILALCLPLFGLSQKETKVYKNDLSINVTSLLGNLLSINDNASGSPYGISYRRFGNKQAIRVSVDGSYSDSDQSSNFNISIRSKTAQVYARIGYERITALAKNINLMYGLDLVGQFESERSEIFTFDPFNGDFQQFNQLDERLLYGGGPSLKFQYILNNRISFFTESNLYFLLGDSKQENSDPTVPNTSEGLKSLSLSMPQSLFVSFTF